MQNLGRAGALAAIRTGLFSLVNAINFMLQTAAMKKKKRRNVSSTQMTREVSGRMNRIR
ncbi:MAG: hypothetical protein AAGJ28_00540 [Pseudomonadota bacterium]